MATIRPAGIRLVTFDCYGTLIDWERGILDAIGPVLRRHGIGATPAGILDQYARIEPEAEAGPAFVPYRTVLRHVARRIIEEHGITPADEEERCLVDSIGTWPAFPDTALALQRLAGAYRLAVVSNVDGDLFAQTARHLPVPFDFVVTAESVRAYKPARAPFLCALQRGAVAPAEVVHAGESLFHDIAPARELGFRTVWVDRNRDRLGAGATPRVTVAPDETVPDLAALADLLLPSG